MPKDHGTREDAERRDRYGYLEGSARLLGIHHDEDAEQQDARSRGQLGDVSRNREDEDDDEQRKNGDVRRAAARMHGA